MTPKSILSTISKVVIVTPITITVISFAVGLVAGSLGPWNNNCTVTCGQCYKELTVKEARQDINKLIKQEINNSLNKNDNENKKE